MTTSDHLIGHPTDRLLVASADDLIDTVLPEAQAGSRWRLERASAVLAEILCRDLTSDQIRRLLTSNALHDHAELLGLAQTQAVTPDLMWHFGRSWSRFSVRSNMPWLLGELKAANQPAYLAALSAPHWWFTGYIGCYTAQDYADRDAANAADFQRILTPLLTASASDLDAFVLVLEAERSLDRPVANENFETLVGLAFTM